MAALDYVEVENKDLSMVVDIETAVSKVQELTAAGQLPLRVCSLMEIE